MSSDEFPVYALGEIATFNTGKLDSNAAEANGIFPFFTCSPNTLAINTHGFDTEAVILAGNNANGIFSVKYFNGKFNAYQRTYVIEPTNNNAISCKYLYFAISHEINFLKEISIGSATKFLTKGILSNIKIKVPQIQVQKEIVTILSSLDDRITLLRETNATLEAIAQALFKSWFVDFDPVRAKAEGRQPEGMDAATAALFPDGFEESELGMVPRGWKLIPFTDTVEILGGGTPKTTVDEYWNGEIPWYSVVDAPTWTDVFVMDTEKHITKLGLESSSTRLLKSGTTIISARGTVGKLAIAGREMAMNQSCYGLSSKVGADYFTYYSTFRIIDILKSMSHGSVFDTITRETLSKVNIIYPDRNILYAFENLVREFMLLIKNNLDAVYSLTNIRDTLLPRLISGQLRLPEAQTAVEEGLL